ncbi:MAG: hypothetical protein JWQ38_1982 [Flavipsychrobacter sp.]|nr:hypothetical protein [Flavipsychrobacter sp.]
MKKLLLVLLLMPVFCFAVKNPCRQIKKTSNPVKKARGYESPMLEHVTVLKQYKPTNFFVLRFYLKDAGQHFGTTGAVVKFADGTELKDESAVVECKQEPSTVTGGVFSTGSQSGAYVLQGFFKITEENVTKLSTTKIESIYLSDVSARLKDKDAVKLKSFIACMKDMN